MTVSLMRAKWLALAALVAPVLWAQTPAGVPTNVVITAKARKGESSQNLQAADIKVSEGHDKVPVTELESLRGTPTQLMILIDDSARSSFDTEIRTLKQFIGTLPNEVEVGVAYMRNGTVDYTSKLTADHAAAANSIRLANGIGGADVSPYDSLSDVVKNWPASNTKRKLVLMISSGIEGLGGGIAPENPYVNKSINDAQRAGVVVYTIYTPRVGRADRRLGGILYGQNFLTQLADETGGTAYITTIGPPVDFSPYLEDLASVLGRQYLLSFEARPEKKAGFQQVKIAADEKKLGIAAPNKVYVKASL